MKNNLSLYRKYRPQRFAELVGQPGAVRVLQQGLREERISHAYLFSGPRGCGKTSAARILAKALNCTNPQENRGEPCNACASCEGIRMGESLDVVEIDAASNRGINEIRELKDHVALSPYGDGWKIYIIDEVHMLTEPAFNALLKTLEEPPEKVLFVLATTEPHKVPVTIRSRCQHLPFHRIEGEVMVRLLGSIVSSEGYAAGEDVLWEIARHSDGALRDALSLLEQALVLEGETLSLEGVRVLLGGSARKEMEDLGALLREDPGKAYALFQELLGRGASVARLYEGLFRLFSDLWITSRWGETVTASLPLPEEEKNYLRKEAPLWDRERLWKGMEFLSHWLPRLRTGISGEVLAALLWEALAPSPKEPSRQEPSPGTPVPENPVPQKRSPSSPGEGHRSPSPKELPKREPSRKRVLPEEPVSSGKTPGPPPPPEPSQPLGSWEDLLARLYAEAPPLCAALLEVVPEKAGDRVAFSLEGEGKHVFVLLTSPGGLRILRPLLGELYGKKTLEFRWKDQTERYDPEDAPEKNLPEELPPRDFRDAVPSGGGSESPGGKPRPALVQGESLLETILSSTSGEILLEKREGADPALLDEDGEMAAENLDEDDQ